VVVMSDSEFHDRPDTTPGDGEDGLHRDGVDSDSSDCGGKCANIPSRVTTINQLNAIGAHVMGLAVDGGYGTPKARFLALAQATGAVVAPADFGTTRPTGCDSTQCCTGANGTGEASLSGQCPLSYAIPRSGGSCPTSDAVVSGIVALANGLTFDIHVVASDVDPGTVDNFIDKLVPNVSGMGPAVMCVVVDPTTRLEDDFIGPKAMPKPATGPGDGIKDTFLKIGTNVQVCFDVVAKENVNVMNTPEPQIFRAQLQVIGQTKTIINGVTTVNSFNLGTPRQVFFLVPPVIMNGPIG
jgi:hypothetical protein